MEPWQNLEEGIGHYGDPSWPMWARIIYSECFRNPANNLRYTTLLSVKIDPKQVKFLGSFGNYNETIMSDVLWWYDQDDKDFWVFTWQGPYSNFRWQGKFLSKRWRFMIGWKIYPRDLLGLPEWDHRRHSAGFGQQFKQI